MMKIMKAMYAAFAMYSRIPVPAIDWNEENRRYALCFFPFIGAVIGSSLFGWQWLAMKLQIGNVLFAAICTFLPIVITGGIHMDGFYDVMDAQSSCQSKEKKLQIMSDPHIGAFSSMKGSLYFLVMFALFTEVRTAPAMAMVSLGFVISRTLSALAAVTFKSAKKEGALQDFVRPAHRQLTVIVLVCLLGITGSLMVVIHLKAGVVVLLTAISIFIYYKKFAYKHFGGITGDLAGYFLQICEIGILTAVVVSFKILEVMGGCI